MIWFRDSREEILVLDAKYLLLFFIILDKKATVGFDMEIVHNLQTSEALNFDVFCLILQLG
jgi:hypothetical protein